MVRITVLVTTTADATLSSATPLSEVHKRSMHGIPVASTTVFWMTHVLPMLWGSQKLPDPSFFLTRMLRAW